MSQSVHSAEAGRLGLADGVPATVAAAFAPVSSQAEAEAYTRGLTGSHYENFSVISVLLPKELRQDFCNVYAFCRVADDLGDEVGDKAKAVELLAGFKRQTAEMFDGLEHPTATGPQTAVFAALQATVKRHAIPREPFLNLIDAFEQDQRVGRYETFAEVVDYCRRSADPVGRIVLYMCGYRDEERQRLSDKTCTALQLANFWQDVRRDMLQRDRIYIPAESLRKYAVTEEQIRTGKCDANFKAMMRAEVDRTAEMFAEGARLLPLLEGRYRRQIALFGMGGQAILSAIRRQDYDTLTRRPSLSKWQKAKLMGAVLGSWVRGCIGGGK